ncbi:MAG: RsmD family RNA methyltransferase [Mucilaginibacter polytrichastri]|nr:RsmD family RNA methyltransferase [Mucilaginibacter polytrichastri]
MRIIGGRLKGIRLNPPKNLPVRPTTDLAKEALFNILNNQVELDGIRVADLFAGTGNMSFEFASRGAARVTAVERHAGAVKAMQGTAEQLQLDAIKAVKMDVFSWLKSTPEKYDIVFADPPYDLDRIPEIAQRVFDQKILGENGLLIIEHQSMMNLSVHPQFSEQRKYGHSSFSFFRNA